MDIIYLKTDNYTTTPIISIILRNGIRKGKAPDNNKINTIKLLALMIPLDARSERKQLIIVLLIVSLFMKF
jgi:hypothetical protein